MFFDRKVEPEPDLDRSYADWQVKWERQKRRYDMIDKIGMYVVVYGAVGATILMALGAIVQVIRGY